MPGTRKPGPSVKDDQTHEPPRDEGASKEKAQINGVPARLFARVERGGRL
jgi:hypothetical protein